MFSLNITCTWSIEKLENFKKPKEFVFLFFNFVVVVVDYYGDLVCQ